MSKSFPAALFVGNDGVREWDEESWGEVERDPRGLLLMWDPPREGAKYIVGMDASEGITGWSRGSRTEDDFKTDNGVIEVFHIDGIREPMWDLKAEKEYDRKNPGVRTERIPDMDPQTKRQRIHYRDVQVAEFAAPCDAVEIARVANVIGRIYRGDEEDAAELIWESWPGCGMLTTQELLRLGYGNLWHWEYISDVAEETNRLGWRSNRESMKLLWYRSRRHLMQRNVVIRSKWLLQEYADAEIDMDKMRARAAYGSHDDRFMAANLCFWAGHSWTYSEDARQPVSETQGPVDFQRFAPVLGDDSPGYADWKESATADWWD